MNKWTIDHFCFVSYWFGINGEKNIFSKKWKTKNTTLSNNAKIKYQNRRKRQNDTTNTQIYDSSWDGCNGDQINLLSNFSNPPFQVIFRKYNTVACHQVDVNTLLIFVPVLFLFCILNFTNIHVYLQKRVLLWKNKHHYL